MSYPPILKGKLVRDKIPEIMRAMGEIPSTRILSFDERQIYLHAKLLEECRELIEAKRQDSIAGEMADVIEVLRAIARYQGISWEDVERREREKRRLRGAFKSFLCLLPTVSPK
jgi:predicted house-cleaning noncanonical NTP pyrophosphatase (MazG superfamily)